MARGLNKVQLIGNTGQDPDIRYTQSGKPVANFSLATSESWKDNDGNVQERTEWHRVVAWEKLAEIIQQYVKKGARLYIEGKLQTQKYEKDGQTHYSTQIVASQMLMLDSKRESTSDRAEQRTDRDGVAGDSAAPTNSKEDLPF